MMLAHLRSPCALGKKKTAFFFVADSRAEGKEMSLHADSPLQCEGAAAIMLICMEDIC
jgi:hypothetical protein